MMQPLRKIIWLVLILVPMCFANAQQADARTSLHDSLRYMLLCFRENAKDTKLIQTIKEAQALYDKDVLSDSLYGKLLVADSLWIRHSSNPDKQRIISCTETLIRLLRQRPPPEEHPDYVRSINNLAALYGDIGRYEKALPLYQQALAIRKRTVGEEHPGYAQSLNNLAVLYGSTGQLEHALPLFLQASAIRKKTVGEQHPDYARSLNNLAILYHDMGWYEKALPLYQQALAIWKEIKGEEHPDHAGSINNLAVLYHDMGRYEQALPLYQLALAIRKTLGEEHPDYIQSVNNLANFYGNMGQYEKALPLRQQVLNTRKKIFGEEHPDYAAAVHNLARLYKKMGRYKEALPLHRLASALWKKTLGEEHPDYAQSLTDLAFLNQELNRYEQALPLFEQALAIRKKTLGTGHPYYAAGLYNLADLYRNMGRYEKALPLYLQALTILEKILGTEHPFYAKSLNNSGLLYSALGDDAKADSLLTRASGIVLRYISRTYTTLSEQEKMTFLDKEANQFDYLPSLLFARHAAVHSLSQQLYANELTLKGMVLEDQHQALNAIRKSNDSTALHLFEQWLLNKTSIGKQLLLPVAKQVPYLDSLQEATILLEQELSRRASSFHRKQYGQGITAKEIAQKLPKDEAAVEFIRFNLYRNKWTDSILYAALVLLPGDTNARFIPLFEERQLRRLLEPSLSAGDIYAQYDAIKKLYDEEAKPAQGTSKNGLYRLIWKPLEKYLTGIHTVYYAPAGLLHRVAFGALRKDAAHLLIDQYRLKQVFSTRSVALPADIAQKQPAVSLWGNIDYNARPAVAARSTASRPLQQPGDTIASSFNFYTADTRGIRGGGWGSLPGAKKEMDSLCKLFRNAGIPVTVDSGTVATEEAFKALSGSSPQVWHLATHGFFLPVRKRKSKVFDDISTGGESFTVQQNPMFRSGLVLAGGNRTWKESSPKPGSEDGILTAYEIAQLDLSNTDLLVLSACETALGDLKGNEGVIGLQRAFKMAGVKQLILSLWWVPDKETSELMTLFYRNWISGQTTREALRSAQLKMKEKYSPFYWAAFVVVE